MRVTTTRLMQLVVCLFFVAPVAGEAQVGKVPRVGVVLPGSPEPEYERRLDAFRRGLRDGGYTEAQNILIEYRWAEAKLDRLPALVAELIRLKVDVLVVDSTPAAHAAKNATSTIPIVLTVVGDPVGTGLVESLARPGGNITGLTLMTPDLSAKRLELLKEVAPKAARVGVLLNPNNRAHALLWREAQRAAPKLRVELQAAEVRRPTDVDRALSMLAGWRADALFVFDDPVLIPAHQLAIIGFAARHRLPTISGLRSLVDAGGLMSFGASFPEVFRNAAAFVVKILGGAKPSELPVEQPTKFELVINVKTAKALGLLVPPALLLRADQVLE